MRTYHPAELAHLQAREGVRPRLLVWITAKRRDTGAIESVGFWNGADDQDFTIGAETRAYHGAGGLLGMDDLTIETGVRVRRMSAWLATAADEVVSAVMAYDLRLAPVQIHRVLTSPHNYLPIAPPHRIWKGWIDGAVRVTPAKGLSSGRITITLASAAMALTRTLSAKYSDEAMRQRGNDDRLFRYADVSGVVPIYWGEKKFTGAAASSPKSLVATVSGSGRARNDR